MTCQAQITKLSFYISGNYPIINEVETKQRTMPVPIAAATGYSSYVTPFRIKESFTPKVGFDVGSRFDYPITPKFFVISGISLGYLRFQRTVELSQISPDIQFHNLPATVGQPFGSLYGSFTWRDPQGNVVLNPPLLPQRSENIGNTATLSIQAPVMIGTNFPNEKLEVRTGALFSYLLHASETKERYNASTRSFSHYKVPA